MDKFYKVFVSSTYEDLKAARTKVIFKLLEMDCYPIAMEAFPATDDDVWLLIQKYIDNCDYYILILAGRYGSTDSDGVGFVEKEYRYALEKGKPIAAFLHSDIVKLPLGRREAKTVSRKKLEEFRRFVSRKHCRYWKNGSELASAVGTSMHRNIHDNPAVGLVRSDQLPSGGTVARTDAEITVHRIESTRDKNCRGLYSLYTALSDGPETNYSTKELKQFMTRNPKGRHVKVENIVLVALWGDMVVGFLLCHFYADHKKAIISYCGIAKENEVATRFGMERMLRTLNDILRNGNHGCDYLFFDISCSGSKSSKRPSNACKLRMRHFQAMSCNVGNEARWLKFEFKCPEVSLSYGVQVRPFVLMCVPIEGQIGSSVPKDKMREFLEFIYMDCYGDLYPKTDSHWAEHQQRLKKVLADTVKKLPKSVSALKLDQISSP